jgi:hypothetical protein
MAFTLNGFGTMFYGEGDRHPDGSFITTEWVAAAYVPLIPLRSYRVARNVAADVNAIVFHSHGYHVLEKLGIWWPQVIRIYGFLAFLVAWWGVGSWVCFTKFDIYADPRAVWIVSIWFLLMLIPFFLIVWIRREAYRSRH